MRSHLPKIALIGRPNVGKSALFNAIINRPLAIVEEEEGVTRDRLYGKSELFGQSFEIIDTGGLLGKNDTFFKEISQQTEIAIEEADGIILVVDGTFLEPHSLDLEVARILRRTKKPLCLAVNKVDRFDRQDEIAARFTKLGIQPLITVSAAHRMNIAELMQGMFSQLPEDLLCKDEEKDEEQAAKDSSRTHIAIIGRPNVGKSMLINSLLGEERSIVSPIAGTTRDMIDTLVERDEEEYCFIDTAGIRRKHKEKVVIEKFAAMRTERAIERADICLLVIDCQDGITHEEKKIAKMIEEAGAGCIVLINKWDLAKGFRMEHAMKGIEQEVPFLSHCPKLIISAKSGRNVEQIFPLIKDVQASMKKRITTGQLNKALMAWMQAYHPPMVGTRRLRIYYMAQVDIKPPKFILFVNSKTLIDDTYKRYLTNQLRKTFEFHGVPFILTIKGRDETENKKAKQKRREEERGEDRKDIIDRDLRSVAGLAEKDEEPLLENEWEETEWNEGEEEQ